MPKYLVQRSYTDQGLNGLLKEGGSKRRSVVEQLAKEMGGRSRQAILRRPPVAAPPCGQRSNCRGRDQVDVRSCLITQLARMIAPTCQ
jgi:hypothetical protein